MEAKQNAGAGSKQSQKKRSLTWVAQLMLSVTVAGFSTRSHTYWFWMSGVPVDNTERE